jgi:hypothetical protein
MAETDSYGWLIVLTTAMGAGVTAAGIGLQIRALLKRKRRR